ncbi:ATP-binding protein [candidate division KSB1 bacterium]
MRIRQILINLLGNSIKFTETGHVKIVAKCKFNPNNSSQLNLMLSVQDTGIGIPDDQKDKVFEAFEQTKGQSTAKFGGTGLGLAITKKLIIMMNGDVNVTGELGKGSQFNVTLRDVAIATVSDIEDLTEDKIDINTIEFEDASILVVDDIETNRKLLIGYLAPFNFTVFEAENGEELLEIAREHKPDLILTDMKMPVMDGFEATKILKDDPSIQHIPVVTITASVMMHDEAKIKEVCDGYLRKPVSMNEIMIELTKYLKHTIIEQVTEETISEGSEDTAGDKESETTPTTAENLPELLKKLKSDYEPLWIELKETLTIDEIEEFAQNIKELGQKHQYGKIVNWGNQLENQAGMFDIDAMTNTLGEFPDIIKDIELKV